MQLLGDQGQLVPASPPVHRLEHPLDSVYFGERDRSFRFIVTGRFGIS